ncbi:hypothetical protein K3722_12180 [Leisingera caerulea]|uniref:Uncharacterized protein n=1 Tax=Leisingera caerulea TaxID=506591 RepID=A0ABY5WSQ0_LEICA|nr:hypothetical protein [Leisingera caerulea]UWQ57282.1 hypothetical protein K3722_12180 [Leisingera caerulea]
MDIKDQTVSDFRLDQVSGVEPSSAADAEAMLKYAELISDPNLTSEQKLKAACALYELLICLWGPVTSGKPWNYNN